MGAKLTRVEHLPGSRWRHTGADDPSFSAFSTSNGLADTIFLEVTTRRRLVMKSPNV